MNYYKNVTEILFFCNKNIFLQILMKNRIYYDKIIKN